MHIQTSNHGLVEADDTTLPSHKTWPKSVTGATSVVLTGVGDQVAPASDFINGCFDDGLVWCADCGSSVQEPCRMHGLLTSVKDRKIPQRAKLTAPHHVGIKILEYRAGDDHVFGVFAHKIIQKRIRFGPYEGKLCDTWDYRGEDRLKLKVIYQNSECKYLDCCDQSVCNWMMYIRPAVSSEQQNLVAYQFRSSIYFATIKAIAPGEELRAWYAGDYAVQMGVPLLKSTASVVGGVAEENAVSGNLEECPEDHSYTSTETQLSRTTPTELDIIRGVSDTPRIKDESKTSIVTRKHRRSKAPLKAWMKGQSRRARTRRLVTLRKLSMRTRMHATKGQQSPVKNKEDENMSSPAVINHDDDDDDNDDEDDDDSYAPPKEETDISEHQACEECGHIFASADDMLEHVCVVKIKRKRRHTIKREAKPKKRHTADVPKVPRKRGRPKSKGELHICDSCGKAFSTPAKLIIHTYTHTGERPHKCSYEGCSKGFTTRFKLLRHELIHGGVATAQFPCAYCDKSFTRKDHLKNHVKVHDPNKTLHKCDQCGKQYASPLAFKTHNAFHKMETGDLNCGVCRLHFEDRESLASHLKVHAGARSIKDGCQKTKKCPHCGKMFFTNKDVNRHVVVHTKKREFMCHLCPQRFGRRDHLVRHLKKTHKKMDVPSTLTMSQVVTEEQTQTSIGGDDDLDTQLVIVDQDEEEENDNVKTMMQQLLTDVNKHMTDAAYSSMSTAQSVVPKLTKKKVRKHWQGSNVTQSPSEEVDTVIMNTATTFDGTLTVETRQAHGPVMGMLGAQPPISVSESTMPQTFISHLIEMPALATTEVQVPLSLQVQHQRTMLQQFPQQNEHPQTQLIQEQQNEHPPTQLIQEQQNERLQTHLIYQQQNEQPPTRLIQQQQDEHLQMQLIQQQQNKQPLTQVFQQQQNEQPLTQLTQQQHKENSQTQMTQKHQNEQPQTQLFQQHQEIFAVPQTISQDQIQMTVPPAEPTHAIHTFVTATTPPEMHQVLPHIERNHLLEFATVQNIASPVHTTVLPLSVLDQHQHQHPPQQQNTPANNMSILSLPPISQYSFQEQFKQRAIPQAAPAEGVSTVQSAALYMTSQTQQGNSAISPAVIVAYPDVMRLLAPPDDHGLQNS